MPKLNKVYNEDCEKLALRLKKDKILVDLIYADVIYREPPDLGTLLTLIDCLRPGGAFWLQTDPSVVSSGRYKGFGSNAVMRMALDSCKDLEYRNEIIWSYSWGGVPKDAFPRKHDVLLYFTKVGACHTFNAKDVAEKKTIMINSTKDWKLPTSVWTGNFFTTSPERIKDPETGKGIVWQKPLWILRRIILACTNPGDLVFEPYLGVAPACVAAKVSNRRYIGCDTNPDRVEMSRNRLKNI